jgi:hypothetical protein
MAKMRSLQRLFPAEPQTERVKTRNFRDLEIDVPAPSMLELAERAAALPRRRLARREKPERYTLEAGALRSMVDDAGAPDHARAFAELAERERLMRAMRQLARRRAGDAPGPAIHT